MLKQISIFVENRPGRLAEITKTISDNNIDIRALSIADTTNFGILRLIVNDPDKAERVLKEAGYTVSMTDVIAAGVEDIPGGLTGALNALNDKGISVEYMYAFIGTPHKEAFVILRVEDIPKAEKVLMEGGIDLLRPEEVYTI